MLCIVYILFISINAGNVFQTSLKSKIQELEEEFRLQKEHLNEQISVVRKNKEEQGSRFNAEIEKKNEELGAQKKSFENDVNELKKTIAQNMVRHIWDKL